MRILFATVLLILFPVSALASDYTGLGTIIIGIPAAVIAFIINLVIKISGSAGSFSYRLSGVATTITVMTTLLVSGDAISMFQKSDQLDKLAAIGLFVLTGISVFIFTRIHSARESLEKNMRRRH